MISYFSRSNASSSPSSAPVPAQPVRREDENDDRPPPLGVRAENDPASPARASGLLVLRVRSLSSYPRALPGDIPRRRPPRRPVRSPPAFDARPSTPRESSFAVASPHFPRWYPTSAGLASPDIPRRLPLPTPTPPATRRPDAPPPRSSRPSARSRCSAATSPSRHPNPTYSTLPYSPRRNTRRYLARRDHPRARAPSTHRASVCTPCSARRRRRFAQTAQTRRDVLVQSLPRRVGVPPHRSLGGAHLARWETETFGDVR